MVLLLRSVLAVILRTPLPASAFAVWFGLHPKGGTYGSPSRMGMRLTVDGGGCVKILTNEGVNILRGAGRHLPNVSDSDGPTSTHVE